MKAGLIFKSTLMSQVAKKIERFALSNVPVMILGQAGTGKELIAKMIHDQSLRRGHPFLSINCGDLRETLLESELFGHETGAFTGAHTAKAGLVEKANNGTLLLKDVSKLCPGAQARLNSFITNGEAFRLGSTNVRIMTTSSDCLDTEVIKGNFREDLYYRLNTVSLCTPALSSRKEDISLLAEHFISELASAKVSLPSEIIKLLEAYTWPGNVRELKSVCEGLYATSQSKIPEVEDLPERILNPNEEEKLFEYDSDLTLYELEKRYIKKALEHFKGNKSQAAGALGITIKTLYNKLHEYGEFENYAQAVK